MKSPTDTDSFLSEDGRVEVVFDLDQLGRGRFLRCLCEGCCTKERIAGQWRRRTGGIRTCDRVVEALALVLAGREGGPPEDESGEDEAQAPDVGGE